MMDGKPTFLTNDDISTVAGSLSRHLDWALDVYGGPIDVAIATAYFNPAGFRLLAPQLERAVQAGGTVRLLLGAEAVPAHRPPSKQEIPGLIDAAAMTSRDRLGFTVEAGSDARSFTRWLGQPGVEARRLTTDFLHGKAYLVTSHNTSAVVGSSNLTFAGLSRNLELNLGAYDPDTVGRVTEWFDRVWQQSDDYKEQLCELFGDRFVEYEPYDVYLRMLLQRYRLDLTAPPQPESSQLTHFQLDGADRAEQILERWGGVLIADGVGLGKTFVAGELLRRAEEERRQRTLVVAPRAVLDSWEKFRRNQNYRFDLISFDQLVDWEGSADSNRVLRDRNRYSMVVVDEAHAFRNDNTLRSEALHQLLAGRPRKQLVLLTATPVNNRLRDLEQLLSFFVPTRSAFVEQGIPNTSEFFRALEKQNPDSLSPEALFPILDEVAVRRTRAFVRKFYPNDTITVDGQQVPVSFPDAQVNPLVYELNAPEFFAQLDHAVSCSIDCDNPAHSCLWPTFTMARYTPSRFALSTVGRDRLLQEGNIAGLLLSGLLKRFESSIVAFAHTCHNMAETHRAFLSALDAGRVLAGGDLNRFRHVIDQLLDEGADPAGYLGDDQGEPVDGYDVAALREAVAADRELLERFAVWAGELKEARDSKVERLLERLHEIDALANDDDERKVLVFSAFSDTVDYLFDAISNHQCETGCPYQGGRVAAVSGSDNRETIADATGKFAPISTERVERSCTDRQLRRGEVDLLIATDVLAEGVNLQQARHLINIDLPWNPMRIVQRHGRVSRIGSPHRTVILDCFFPDADLEALLSLEDRLRRKIAQANAGVGVEEAPLPGADAAGHVFNTGLSDAGEIIELAKGSSQLIERSERGPAGTSGEEFRRELVRVLIDSDEERARIERLPSAVGSGRYAPVAETTYLFCATVAGRERYAAVRGGSVVSTDTLEVLHAARCSEGDDRVLTDEDQQGAYPAWETARDEILRQWYPLTDSKTVEPRIPKVMRDAAALVRGNPHVLPGGRQQVASLTDRIEGAYSTRIEKRFRELTRQELTPEEHVRRIAELADELDLQPYRAQQPLPMVEPADVELVAWLVLSPAKE